MPNSPNKGYTQPSYNTEVGTWGTDLNTNFSGIVDNNLGGYITIALTSSNVTLTSTQSQNLVYKLTGTLLANVNIYSPIKGFCIVENNTSGSYTVNWIANFGGGNVGSTVTIPQGSSAFLVSDASAGARSAGGGSFPSGTKTTFYQAAAPTGWTQVVTYNDYLPRIISGTGGVNHAGTRGFSVANGSITIDGHVLTIAEMPAHNHTDAGHTHPLGSAQPTSAGGSFISYASGGTSSNTGTGYASIGNTGGGTAHTHTLTLGISYLDFILCTKS